MTENEIKRWCRSFYGLNGNTKIYRLNEDSFTIKIGSCMADIKYPKCLLREIKLEQLLQITFPRSVVVGVFDTTPSLE